MATTALSVMRQAIGKLAGGMVTGSASANGTSLTLIDTVGLAQYENNADALTKRFVLLTSGTYSGQERFSDSFAQASGTITVYNAFGGAPGTASTYEVARFSATDVKDSINAARQLFSRNPRFCYLYAPVTDKTVFTRFNQRIYEAPTTFEGEPLSIYLERLRTPGIDDNIFTDGDFDTWSGGLPTAWDTRTNLTVTQNTDEDLTKDGGNSAKCVAAASSTCYLLDTIDNPGNYSGQKLNLSIWVYSTTASRIEANITDNAGATVSSTKHGGSGWELMEIERNITNACTSLQAGIDVTSGVAFTFFVDSAILVRGQAIASRAPLKILDWHWRESDRTIHFDYYLPDNRQLVMEGVKALSSVSVDTDTVEVGEPYVRLIYYHALTDLYQQLAAQNPTTQEYASLAAYWERRLQQAKVNNRMPVPHHTVKRPGWAYSG